MKTMYKDNDKSPCGDPSPAVAAMGDWESTLRRLLVRGKVHAVAVVDGEGRHVASVPDTPVPPEVGASLVTAVSCPYACRFTLPFSGDSFTCFSDARGVVVGRAGDLVLAGTRARGVGVVVGVAESRAPGSCLYEVSCFASTLRKSLRRSTPSSAALVLAGVGAE